MYFLILLLWPDSWGVNVFVAYGCDYSHDPQWCAAGHSTWVPDLFPPISASFVFLC